MVQPYRLPCSLQPGSGSHAAYPPADPSKSGPWAKDLETFALLQSPGGRAEYEKTLLTRSRRRAFLNNKA